MELIQTIRNEIKRRYKEFDGKTGDIATASRLAYLDVLSFLDTLQDPEISNELLEPTRAVRLPDGRLVTEKLARQIDINLLNKAADEMALRAFPEKKSYSTVIDRVVDYNAVDRKNYRDGILAGAELMKKQMPKWYKVERGSCFDKHTNFILSARESHFYCSAMEVPRDGYIILVDELERLPKEDEK